MTDSTLSAETAGAAISASDLFYAVQSGAGGRKVTGAQVKTWAQSGLATVATSGAYSDLSGKPTLVTALTGLSDVNVTEGAGIDGQVLFWKNADGKWEAKALATVATSGAYSDLTGAPAKTNTAASDPGTGNDSSQGYAAGSMWFNTSTGALWRCYSASVGAAVWDRQDYADHPGYVAGNWYSPTQQGQGAGAAFASGTAKFIPWIPKQTCTISQLGANVSTLGTGNAQFAIYASDQTTKRPTGTALATVGSVSTGSTGFISGALSGNVQVQAGQLYWLGCNTDNSTVQFVIPNANGFDSWLIGSATGANVVKASPLTSISTPLTFGTWGDLTAASWTEQTTTSFCLVAPKVLSVP